MQIQQECDEKMASLLEAKVDMYSSYEKLTSKEKNYALKTLISYIK